jgi:hypothetical protein
MDGSLFCPCTIRNWAKDLVAAIKKQLNVE